VATTSIVPTTRNQGPLHTARHNNNNNNNNNNNKGTHPRKQDCSTVAALISSRFRFNRDRSSASAAACCRRSASTACLWRCRVPMGAVLRTENPRFMAPWNRIEIKQCACCTDRSAAHLLAVCVWRRWVMRDRQV